MKKRVYLVQIGTSYSSPCFFPYAMGCIAAQLKRDKTVTELLDIPDIITMREPVDTILKRFVAPDFVAISHCTWNAEYNKVLAKRLKELYPDVIILFGGHSVDQSDDLLRELPFVDILCHNEGEETIPQLLKALCNGTSLADIPNISYRKNENIITTELSIPCDISGYPSPYLNGIFDNLLKEFPEVEFHAVLETNRGCPYSCAYCKWYLTHKLRLRPIETIKAEIEWVASHHIKYCYCADANFGILERDVEIAAYVVEMKKKYGYPDVFKPCYAKESDETVFKAGYILNKNNTDKGVTLTYQSLDPQTLENIGRKNLTLEHFAELNRRYVEAGIPTYTELILGLPGETYQSFCQGICRLLESGQDNSMLVYECQVFPNTRMADPDYQKKFGIKTSRIPLLGVHYNPQFNGVKEYFDIITETASMPHKDWVDANMFSVILQTFHHLGLLRFFAVYLHREHHLSYFDFYSRLFDFIYHQNTGYLNELFTELWERKNDVSGKKWTYQKDIFSSTGFYFEEAAFLELVTRLDTFWEEILPFLQSFSIEKSVFEALFTYQKELIRTLNKKELTLRLPYNFYPYFEDRRGEILLRRVPTTLHVTTDTVAENWADYARKIIWFGKRHSATLMVNPKETVFYSEGVSYESDEPLS